MLQIVASLFDDDRDREIEILAQVIYSLIVMATVVMILNYDCTEIMIVNYDPKTFIVQATDDFYD